MSRDIDSVIEQEVRRRLTDALAGAGIPGDRVAIEVLYMLPPEFVRGYKEIFERALSWSPQTAGGGGKDEGRIKASGKTKGGKGEQGMHTREMPPAKAGKGTRSQHFVIRDEIYMKEKNKLDKRLLRVVSDSFRAAADAKTKATDEISRDGHQSPRSECGECGRRLGNGWIRCPFHS